MRIIMCILLYVCIYVSALISPITVHLINYLLLLARHTPHPLLPLSVSVLIRLRTRPEFRVWLDHADVGPFLSRGASRTQFEQPLRFYRNKLFILIFFPLHHGKINIRTLQALEEPKQPPREERRVKFRLRRNNDDHEVLWYLCLQIHLTVMSVLDHTN